MTRSDSNPTRSATTESRSDSDRARGDQQKPDSARWRRRGTDRAQSEVVGVGLIIAVSLLATVGVVVLGAAAVSDAQSQSELDRVENAMTQLNSEAATVALGDSDVRSVSMGRSPGSFDVAPDAGTIRVVHEDYDGEGTDEVLYEGTLGAVLYEAPSGAVIGYQGGGVWRASADGNSSRMVSPPEFHYRGATLTLPIVTVNGESTGAGDGRARIVKGETGQSVYPADTTYEDTPDREYDNPVTGGNLTVEVESQFYQAWARYFESRTEGDVQVFHEEERVEVELLTRGAIGEFTMPAEGAALRVRGVDETEGALSDFEITIRPSQTDSADFSNLEWSMAAEEGDHQLEFAVRGDGNMDCEDEEPVSVSVYYSGDGGDTYEGWQNDQDYRVQCDEDDNAYVTVDFTADDTEMTYSELGQSDLVEFSPQQATHDPNPFEDENQTARTVTTHYFDAMPSDFDLVVSDRNGGVSEAASSGYIEYEGDGRVVTFLHVTENGVEVRIS